MTENGIEIESGVHASLIRNLRKVVPVILHAAFLLDKAMGGLQAVSLGRDDILFLPDDFSNPVLMGAIMAVPIEEAIHIVLIHDIFHIKYPQLFRREHVDLSNLPYIFKWAHRILSVSQSSLNEIASFGAQFGHAPLYDYFHLGADFGSQKAAEGIVRPALSRMFEGPATYLMVGTIEPRKNHRYVLEAFRRLWNNNSNVRLCIVGRVGWKYKETIEEIKASPKLNSELFMLNDATDSELTYCYAHAKAVIIASIAEGTDCTLIEAINFGKMVFASDIPVFHEIAEDYPVYFSLDDPQDLCERILEFEEGNQVVKKSSFVPLSWDESVRELFQKVVKMAESIESTRAFTGE